MSKRPREQCALWRVAAFLRIVQADENALRNVILPSALSRLRKIILSKKFNKDAAINSKAIFQALIEATGPHSEFERAVTCPETFFAFDDAFDEVLPLHLVGALRESYGIQEDPMPLSAQYLLEGVDAWMTGNSREENERMVYACGVSPAAVADALSVNPLALSDFVIDVMFPEGSSVWCRDPPVAPSRVLDWISQTLSQIEQCASDAERCSLLDKYISGAPKLLEDLGQHHQTTRRVRKRRRTSGPFDEEAADKSDDDGQKCKFESDESSLENEDAEFLTEENLGELLLSAPHVIPKDVLIARRKPILDPSITLFELEHHYTVSELREAVCSMLEAASGAPTEDSGSSVGICWQGKKKTVVEDVFQALPRLRAVAATSARNLSQSEAGGTKCIQVIDVDEEDDKEKSLTDAVSTILTTAQQNCEPEKTTVKMLVNGCTRQMLELFLMSCKGGSLSRDVVAKLKTKLDCAKRIAFHVSKEVLT